MYFSKENRKTTLIGIIFISIFTYITTYIANIKIISSLGISPLVVAIILGIIYGNSIHHKLSIKWSLGIQFSAKQLLRVSIILYGFRVSFQQISAVGIEGLLLDIFVVSITLIGGAYIGVKLFRLDRHLAILISSGSAICGAAAVLAVEGVLKSEPYKSSVAVGTVIIFGTLAMFLYPIMHHHEILSLSASQFGIFAGASIHEVAQALVAGNSISVGTGNIAVIVKMTRVLLLIPVLILLSVHESKKSVNNDGSKPKITVPWFAIVFAVVIGFNSLNLLPSNTVSLINQLDLFLLSMAMSAIGIETNLNKIRKVGLKPLYFAVVLFCWLTISVYSLIKFYFSILQR